MQKHNEEAAETCTVSDESPRNDRFVGYKALVDEESDEPDETKDERGKNFGRVPWITDASPCQSDDRRGSAGDDEDVATK